MTRTKVDDKLNVVVGTKIVAVWQDGNTLAGLVKETSTTENWN